MRSTGMRFLIVGLLTLLMFIPLFFVGIVVDDRADYSREARSSVGERWGGPQQVNGPFLVVPMSGPVTRFVTDGGTALPPALDAAQAVEDVARGNDMRQVTKIEALPSLIIAPGDLQIDAQTSIEMRKIGIFDVPVYRGALDLRFDFPVADAEQQIKPDQTLHWDEAELVLYLSDNRGLRGAASLGAGAQSFPLEPNSDRPGLRAALGDPRQLDLPMALTLSLNGAERLTFAPVGRNTEVVLKSDWPHPSFTGGFLPDSHDITDQGFSARWQIPHLARNLPQFQKGLITDHRLSFGAQFYTPNDFYQKATRAASYSILFIALTFLAVLLIENPARPAHPVQYVLIGLAQAVFVLLMVAYSEQIGFALAYLGASIATIALLVFFGATGLRLGRRSWVLGALLAVLYAMLYLILRSADYALLMGATLVFGALAATIYATRNEDWWGAPRADREVSAEGDPGPEAPGSES